MVCSRCGAKLGRKARRCTACGEVLARPNNHPGAPDPALKRKRLLLVGAAIAAVVVTVLLIFSFSSRNRAEKAAKALYSAVTDLDMNRVGDCLPPAVIQDMEESLDLKDSKMKIRSAEELSREEVEDIDALYGIAYGTEEGYVEAASVVYAEITYHGELLSEEAVPLTMIQIGGDWYVEVFRTAEALEEIGLSVDFLP